MTPHDDIRNEGIENRAGHRRAEPDKDGVPQRAYKAGVGEYPLPVFHCPWIGDVKIAESPHEGAHQEHDHGHYGHGESRQRDYSKYRPAPSSQTRRVGAEATSRHGAIVALAEVTALQRHHDEKQQQENASKRGGGGVIRWLIGD